jgi:hypothetical protein
VYTVHAAYKKLEGTCVFPFLFASFLIIPSELNKEDVWPGTKTKKNKKKTFTINELSFCEFLITGVYCTYIIVRARAVCVDMCVCVCVPVCVRACVCVWLLLLLLF